MKRLKTRYEEEKNRKRNRLTFGLILIAVMVLSTLGYALQGGFNSDNSEKADYNGYEFVSQNGFWILNNENLGNVNLIFSYNPEEIEELDEILK